MVKEREREGRKQEERGSCWRGRDHEGGKEEWRETKKEKENLTYMSSHGIMIALYSRPSSVVCVVHM